MRLPAFLFSLAFATLSLPLQAQSFYAVTPIAAREKLQVPPSSDPKAPAVTTIHTIGGDDIISAQDTQGPIAISGDVTVDGAVRVRVGGVTQTAESMYGVWYVEFDPQAFLSPPHRVVAWVSDESPSERAYSVDTEVSLSASADSAVAVVGQPFLLSGSIDTDIESSDQIEFYVESRDSFLQASVDLDAGRWSVELPASALVAGSNAVTLHLSGFDVAGNWVGSTPVITVTAQ